MTDKERERRNKAQCVADKSSTLTAAALNYVTHTRVPLDDLAVSLETFYAVADAFWVARFEEAQAKIKQITEEHSQ